MSPALAAIIFAQCNGDVLLRNWRKRSAAKLRAIAVVVGPALSIPTPTPKGQERVGGKVPLAS
jgi:hypothetical protein